MLQSVHHHNKHDNTSGAQGTSPDQFPLDHLSPLNRDTWGLWEDLQTLLMMSLSPLMTPLTPNTIPRSTNHVTTVTHEEKRAHEVNTVNSFSFVYYCVSGENAPGMRPHSCQLYSRVWALVTWPVYLESCTDPGLQRSVPPVLSLWRPHKAPCDHGWCQLGASKPCTASPADNNNDCYSQ